MFMTLTFPNIQPIKFPLYIQTTHFSSETVPLYPLSIPSPCSLSLPQSSSSSNSNSSLLHSHSAIPFPWGLDSLWRDFGPHLSSRISPPPLKQPQTVPSPLRGGRGECCLWIGGYWFLQNMPGNIVSLHVLFFEAQFEESRSLQTTTNIHHKGDRIFWLIWKLPDYTLSKKILTYSGSASLCTMEDFSDIHFAQKLH